VSLVAVGPAAVSLVAVGPAAVSLVGSTENPVEPATISSLGPAANRFGLPVSFAFLPERRPARG